MNFVSLLGRINGFKDSKTVLLEVARPESSNNVANLLIPCQYWTQDEHNLLTQLKPGTRVVVRGRIDQDEKNEMFIIVEQVTIIK